MSEQTMESEAHLVVGCQELFFGVEYVAHPLMVEVIHAYRADKGLPDISKQDVGYLDLGDGLKEEDRAVIGNIFASRLERDLGAVSDLLRVGVGPMPPDIRIEGSGVSCCGPGFPDMVSIYGLAFTGVEQLTIWASFAVGLRQIVKRLRERTRHPVYLTRGTAIFIAADAIQRGNGEGDLTLAFSTEVNPHMTRDFGLPHVDGFAVGFRNKSSVRIVLMDPCGQKVVVRLLRLP
jgi:hypothetical protein